MLSRPPRGSLVYARDFVRSGRCSLLPSPELAEGWGLNIQEYQLDFSARITGWIPEQVRNDGKMDSRQRHSGMTGSGGNDSTRVPIIKYPPATVTLSLSKGLVGGRRPRLPHNHIPNLLVAQAP